MKSKTCAVALVATFALFVVNTVNHAAAADDAPRVTRLISPDGQHVAYGLYVVGPNNQETSRIVVSKLDGSDRRALGVAFDPSDDVYWFGDDRLAYSPDREATLYEVISLTGESLTQLRMPDGCNVLYKRLSPDGQMIAYVGSYGLDKTRHEHGLFVVDVGAHDVRRVLDLAVKSAPAWSPDARRLAIGAAAGYVRDYPLVTIDARSGRVESLGCQGVGAAWSPDGKQLALTTKILRGGSWGQGIPNDGRIGVWNLAAKQMRIVSPRASNHHDAEGWHLEGSFDPLWSPDGRRLAYRLQKQIQSSPKSKRSHEVWVVDLADDAAQQKPGRLVLAQWVDQMAWAPDNRTLVWVASGRLGHTDVDAAAKVAAPSSAAQAETKAGRFCVYGTVTDETGRPLKGAKITVVRGIATLFSTPPVLSDDHGNYEIHFDKGVMGSIPQQAAVVHVAKDGYYDRDLGAAGNLGMSEKPLDDPGSFVGMVYPGRRHRLDFVMLKAARLHGRLVDAAGQPLADYDVTIEGDTYPATNVLASLKTDANGRFEFLRLPRREYRFRLGHRQRIISEPIDFARPGDWHLELTYDALAATLEVRINEKPE